MLNSCSCAAFPSTNGRDGLRLMAVVVVVLSLRDVAKIHVQDEQQIKHYREDTARMRKQISELQTRYIPTTNSG